CGQCRSDYAIEILGKRDRLRTEREGVRDSPQVGCAILELDRGSDCAAARAGGCKVEVSANGGAAAYNNAVILWPAGAGDAACVSQCANKIGRIEPTRVLNAERNGNGLAWINRAV